MPGTRFFRLSTSVRLSAVLQRQDHALRFAAHWLTVLCVVFKTSEALKAVPSKAWFLVWGRQDGCYLQSQVSQSSAGSRDNRMPDGENGSLQRWWKCGVEGFCMPVGFDGGRQIQLPLKSTLENRWRVLWEDPQEMFIALDVQLPILIPCNHAPCISILCSFIHISPFDLALGIHCVPSVQLLAFTAGVIPNAGCHARLCKFGVC